MISRRKFICFTAATAVVSMLSSCGPRNFVRPKKLTINSKLPDSISPNAVQIELPVILDNKGQSLKKNSGIGWFDGTFISAFAERMLVTLKHNGITASFADFGEFHVLRGTENKFPPSHLKWLMEPLVSEKGVGHRAIVFTSKVLGTPNISPLITFQTVIVAERGPIWMADFIAFEYLNALVDAKWLIPPQDGFSAPV